MSALFAKRTSEPEICTICARAHDGLGYGKPVSGKFLWVCLECAPIAKRIEFVKQKDIDHYERVAISTAAQKIVQGVVTEVLEAVFRDGVTDLNTLQPEQFDMLCERMAVEGRMIEHGKEFLLAYAAEMHGQVSRGDAPF